MPDILHSLWTNYQTLTRVAFILQAMAAVLALVILLVTTRKDDVKDAADQAAADETALKISRANERAAAADERAAAAIAKAAELTKEAERARLEQEKLQKGNLELGLALERERMARLEIEQRIAHRHVTPEQYEYVRVNSGLLKGISLTLLLLGDAEANHFGVELGRFLAAFGARVSYSSIGVYSPPPYGIFVISSPGSEGAKLVLKVFSDAQIPARHDPRQNGSDVRILVGLKPLAPDHFAR